MKTEIKLRKLNVNDLKSLMRLYPEEELLKNTGHSKKPKDVTIKDERKWLQNSIKDYSKKKPEMYNFAIEVGGEFAGIIGANKIKHEDESITIGYWLGKEYRGKGIMTIALKKFLKEMDNKFHPIRVQATVLIFNPSSSKVLEKCGFKCEGIRRKVKKINGKFYDDKLYAKIR